MLGSLIGGELSRPQTGTKPRGDRALKSKKTGENLKSGIDSAQNAGRDPLVFVRTPPPFFELVTFFKLSILIVASLHYLL